MIPIGTGIDIVEIERIQKMHAKHGQHFIERLLHKVEIEQLKEEKNIVAFLAKRFAVKEATAKAMGVGIGEKIGFTDVYVEHDELGKPLLKFTPRCIEKLDLKNKRTLLTISDERSYAVAHVLLFSS